MVSRRCALQKRGGEVLPGRWWRWERRLGGRFTATRLSSSYSTALAADNKQPASGGGDSRVRRSGYRPTTAPGFSRARTMLKGHRAVTAGLAMTWAAGDNGAGGKRSAGPTRTYVKHAPGGRARRRWLYRTRWLLEYSLRCSWPSRGVGDARKDVTHRVDVTNVRRSGAFSRLMFACPSKAGARRLASQAETLITAG